MRLWPKGRWSPMSLRRRLSEEYCASPAVAALRLDAAGVAARVWARSHNTVGRCRQRHSPVQSDAASGMTQHT
ncbi:hypothetical protein CBM2599_B50389 [Cupriavidus taiwanensis]|nr:hypothetical protein CBM2599_B50389 [Cupriavidus taiwanensis]